MPGVICHRARPQDCASLGHLYRSSPNAARSRPVRTERHLLPHFLTGNVSGLSRYGLGGTPSLARVSLPALLILSPEVVLLALAELPGHDILRCRSVCRLLKLFIDHSAKLRYIVEAHARGLNPLQSSNPAQYLISQLLARERSWTMFGSIPGVNDILDIPVENEDDDDESPSPAELVVYDSGRVLVCRGSRLAIQILGPGQSEVQQFLIPGLRNAVVDSIVGFGESIAFSDLNVVYVYSLANSEIVRALPAPRRGTIGVLRVQGDLLAGLFSPERQSSGVLVWNWKTGQLIDTLFSAGAPALSFGFLNQNEIALIRTNQSAGSARLDIYTIGSSSAFCRSSFALPDAHPSKWYAKAEIHCGGTIAPPGCEPLRRDYGIIAINLELRVRSPHTPTATLTNRKLSTILVVQQQALANDSASSCFSSEAIPWYRWSSNRVRVLSNVRLVSTLHASPVWGNRIVALGPEPDQVSLFDFCSVGVKASSVVWKTPSASGTASNFSGGGGGRINGGVSVRAALAQRARTLVRVNSLGISSGWFEGMGVGAEGVVEQMPYVVSVRRGMSGVDCATLDGDRVVVLKSEENSGGMVVTKVTSFVFSV
ncbi:hypothetical protein FRC12_016304 [Ceratobasidium sp. 428]|nr:hypothetical protein FRC12_016304 [Ceratobasidium sp. 428]